MNALNHATQDNTGKPRKGIEPSNTPSLLRKRMSNGRTTGTVTALYNALAEQARQATLPDVSKLTRLPA